MQLFSKAGRIAVYALVLSLMSTPTVFAEGQSEAEVAVDEETLVEFVEVNWLDIEATTGITRFVVESLGYETESSDVSVPVAFQALDSDEADVFLGIWMPSMQSEYTRFIEEGSVEEVATNLEGARYTLAVPQYVYDSGVTSIADLDEHEDEFDGEIYGIESGNDGNRLILDMIEDDAFGLSGWDLIESSEAAMLSEVGNAIRNEQWIVFLGWEPHPMNTRFDIDFLADGDDYFGPDYGAATVRTAVREGYLEESPNIGRFFQNLEFTLEMENELMLMIDEEDMDARDAGREWLAENPGILDEWLDGVLAVDGTEGVEAVRAELGLD